MDYVAIATEIVKPAYAGMTDAQIATALMALTVQPPNIDVPAGGVIGYLALQGKLVGLKKYVAGGVGNSEALIAADELLTLLQTPGINVFRTSDAATYGAIQGFLNALAGDATSGITSGDVTALLAMATPPPIPAFGRDPAAIIDASVVERARLGETVTGA